MKKNISWLSTILVVAIAVYLIDLNVSGYHIKNNTIPVLRYSIIALSIAFFIMVANILFRKKNKNK